ncbi:NUDIX domain-containing protein [candidate division KSB1 bacterium]
MNIENNDTPSYPEVTVGALIFNAQDQLLLVKTYKWKDMYCVPGGHVELGESLVDAVMREVKEETNLDVNNAAFHCVQEAIFSESFHKKRHFIFLDFICRSDAGEVVLNEEASEFEWIDLDNVDEYLIEPYTRKTIDLYLNNESGVLVNSREV